MRAFSWCSVIGSLLPGHSWNVASNHHYSCSKHLSINSTFLYSDGKRLEKDGDGSNEYYAPTCTNSNAFFKKINKNFQITANSCIRGSWSEPEIPRPAFEIQLLLPWDQQPYEPHITFVLKLSSCYFFIRLRQHCSLLYNYFISCS